MVEKPAEIKTEGPWLRLRGEVERCAQKDGEALAVWGKAKDDWRVTKVGEAWGKGRRGGGQGNIWNFWEKLCSADVSTYTGEKGPISK